MLKRFLMAIVPVTMLAAAVHADDNELVINAASIADADVEIVESALDIDVDQLTADAGSEQSTDAVEACFRRFGYRCGGWGGYRSYCNYGYSSWGCYRPYYSVGSYYCARPLYHCGYVAAPIYNYYWGCY